MRRRKQPQPVPSAPMAPALAHRAGRRVTALFGAAHVPQPGLLIQTPRGWVFDPGPGWNAVSGSG